MQSPTSGPTPTTPSRASSRLPAPPFGAPADPFFAGLPPVADFFLAGGDFAVPAEPPRVDLRVPVPSAPAARIVSGIQPGRAAPVFFFGGFVMPRRIHPAFFAPG